MTNNNSDFSSKPRYYTEYYQLNSIPETMLLIEAEYLEIPAKTTDSSQSSLKGVMCALGVMMALIFGSTWQLFRSLDAVPDHPHATKEDRLSRIIIPRDRQDKLAIKEIEILIQKNAIANGKF